MDLQESDIKLKLAGLAGGVEVGKDVTPLGETTTVRLDYVTMNRRLYHPNEIVADLVFSSEPSADTLTGLLWSKVEMLRYSKSSSVKTDPTAVETLTGFYVHDMIPLKMSGKYFHVRLHIYSLDNQLTLRKYCRTYIGKRLFTDILLEGCAPATTTDWNQSSPTYNTLPGTLKLSFQTYYKASTVDTEKNNIFTTFDHLKSNINTSGKEEFERIQPYLVQYNESFYEFMARTANRCGEFFFWDEGALRFGRTCTGDNILGEIADLKTEITDDDCLSVYYTSVHASDGLKTTYATIDDQNDSKSLFDSDEKMGMNYAKTGGDINPSTFGVYDEELNHDVYRTISTEDKFDSTAGELFDNAQKFVVSLFSHLLNNTTIMELISSFVSSTILNNIIAAKTAKTVNDRETKHHFTDDKSKTIPNSTLREGKDKAQKVVHALYTAINTKAHVNSEFYQTIRQKEDELSGQLIVFNLANSKSGLHLGNLFKYNGVPYIVIQIKERSAANAVTGSSFAFLDQDAEAPFKDMGKAVMQVVAIPLDNNTTAYPPLRPEGHVRIAEPQIAFVTDYRDPQNRGRVRIRYPWQTKETVIVNSTNTDVVEASPWIPVLTPSATPGGGLSVSMAVGDEVLIDYEAGNVERPYVAGARRNRKNPIPFRRGDLAFISKNGHGIAFDDPIDDTKFLESILPAYGLCNQWASPVAERGTNKTIKLTGGTTITDQYGFYSIEMSTDRRMIDISCPLGKVNINAFTGINVIAPNGDIEIKGQNINIEAGNVVKLTSGLNVKAKSDWDGAWAAKDWKLGTLILGDLLEPFADIFRPLVTVVDLDLLRKVAQAFMAPMDGTFEIKSHKYLLLEANGGHAYIENNRYRASSSRNDLTSSYSMSWVNTYLPGVVSAIQVINTHVETTMEKLHQAQQNVNAAMREYNTARHDGITHNTIQTGSRTGYEIANRVIADNGDGTLTFTDDSATYDTGYFWDTGSSMDAALNDIRKTKKAATDLITAIKAYCTAYTKTPPSKFRIGANKSRFYDYVGNHIPNWGVDTFPDPAAVPPPAAPPNYTDPNTRKRLKQDWFVAVWGDIRGAGIADFPYGDFPAHGRGGDSDTSWKARVQALTKEHKDDTTDVWRGIKNGIFKNNVIDMFQSVRDDRWAWEAGQDGQIIIADNSDQSFNFDSTGVAAGNPGKWKGYDNEDLTDDDDGLNKLKQVLHQWD